MKRHDIITARLDAPVYDVNELSPLPRDWHDHLGNLRLMTRKPVENYVMLRPHGAAPFCIHIRDLLNISRHWARGPFVVGKKPVEVERP